MQGIFVSRIGFEAEMCGIFVSEYLGSSCQVFAGICILRLGTTGFDALALATPVNLRPVIVICLS